jgi:hypothetical protein
MSLIGCADGADEMNFRAVELRSVVIHHAEYPESKKNLLPLTTNLFTAGFQIKLREFFLRFGRG